MKSIPLGNLTRSSWDVPRQVFVQPEARAWAWDPAHAYESLLPLTRCDKVVPQMRWATSGEIARVLAK